MRAFTAMQLERVTPATSRRVRARLHNVGESSTENAIQINVGVWHRDLRDVFNSGKQGPGAIALLQLINLQLAQAAEWTAGITEDEFIDRSLAGWRDDWEAAQARLTVLVAELQTYLDTIPDPSARALAIYTGISRPVLDGIYPAALLAKFPEIAKRGITIREDGTGKGFGDAFGSATLWNQAVIAGDVNRKLGEGWAKDAIRTMLTNAAVQLEESGPGEDPTARDATIKTLRAIAEAPGDILRALGLGPAVWLAILVAGVVVLVLVFRK